MPPKSTQESELSKFLKAASMGVAIAGGLYFAIDSSMDKAASRIERRIDRTDARVERLEGLVFESAGVAP